MLMMAVTTVLQYVRGPWCRPTRFMLPVAVTEADKIFIHYSNSHKRTKLSSSSWGQPDT